MDMGAVAAAGKAVTDPQAEAQLLKEACRGFESLFIRILLEEMRKTVTQSSVFGSRREEWYFTEMLDDSLADAMAESGGVGLADVLYDQLARQRLEIRG
jgi:flagellar protein FlgJ